MPDKQCNAADGAAAASGCVSVMQTKLLNCNTSYSNANIFHA
jgi:hypothetical protein